MQHISEELRVMNMLMGEPVDLIKKAQFINLYVLAVEEILTFQQSQAQVQFLIQIIV